MTWRDRLIQLGGDTDDLAEFDEYHDAEQAWRE